MSLYDAVSAMYAKLGLSTPENPQSLDAREKKFRVDAMLEEVREYESASSLEDELDALVDVVVFALGTAYRQGLHQFERAFHRVISANSQKVVGPNQKRGAFELDLIKPEGWVPPDLSDLVVSTESQDATQFPPSAMSQKEMVEAVAAAIERDELDENSRRELIRVLRSQAEVKGWMHPSLLEANALQVRKAKDYGAPDWARKKYHPFGHKSYQHMIILKLNRLLSLTPTEEDDVVPEFESLKDTVLDLINYASFYAAWLDERYDE